jgi:ATP-dependent RNA helicase DDX10/DBP4
MRSAVLFATDIAARGLDFPSVDWVIQLDCPEDADTYIHRVGRTARFDAAGQALLFLLPSEKEAMQAELAKKKVPIEEVKIRASKQQSIQNQLQSFCFQDPEIKHLGQKVREWQGGSM